MINKRCCQCKKELPILLFGKCKSRKDGLNVICKDCSHNNYLKNRHITLAKEKQRREKFPEKEREKSRLYRKKNLEKCREHEREYSRRNRIKRNLYAKNYWFKNKDRLKVSESKRIATYFRKRLKTDIKFRIRKNLSTRIYHALKNNIKSQRTKKLLGCEINYFKEYLESLFLPGMTWENYGHGQGKWVIDHKIPCRAFDLSQEKEQLKCFNYTNLRPFWFKDNSLKSDYLENGISARKFH